MQAARMNRCFRTDPNRPVGTVLCKWAGPAVGALGLSVGRASYRASPCHPRKISRCLPVHLPSRPLALSVSRLPQPHRMAGSGGSPDADDPNCGGAGAEPSRTPQESDDRYSAPASPLSTRPSGQPPGTLVVANEGSASSSAWGSDDDDNPTNRYKNPAVGVKTGGSRVGGRELCV